MQPHNYNVKYISWLTEKIGVVLQLQTIGVQFWAVSGRY